MLGGAGGCVGRPFGPTVVVRAVDGCDRLAAGGGWNAQQMVAAMALEKVARRKAAMPATSTTAKPARAGRVDRASKAGPTLTARPGILPMIKAAVHP